MANSGTGIMCDAFVLAGGKSSRLGRPKAFVSLAGHTLIERAVLAIREGLGDVRITAVSAADEATFPVDLPDIPLIKDIYRDRGPLGGLHAALLNASAHWIFILACDLPFVSGGLIRLLAGKIDSAGDGCGAIIPVQRDGRIQPLCGFYKVEAASGLVENAMSLQPAPAMHQIVKSLGALYVAQTEYDGATGEEDPFLNVNTERDLERAVRRLR